MTKVVCCPENLLPNSLDPEVFYFTTFRPSKRVNVGHMGLDLPHAVRSSNLAPSVVAWDFATFAFAVDAADKTILRKTSSDGWTRMIDLNVSLVDPTPWTPLKGRLEQILGFLTGDFWTLTFEASNLVVPIARRPLKRNADCVCLLSGGADSLVGAIDLTVGGRSPLFVSHIARGSGDAQSQFATRLGAIDRHFKWSFSVKHNSTLEQSTRARSIVFFAFAALAASAVPANLSGNVEIVVPENGLISLNVPLGPGRIGSLSTKTTHPVYMSGIQEIWDTLHINAKLAFPYSDKTKGEMFHKCADQKLFVETVASSVSCGKYQRHGLTHCGECVPCLIRRAAFRTAQLNDTTERNYICSLLKYSQSKDVVAAANACIRFQTQGIHRFVGGALSFASDHDKAMYEGVVSKGMMELSVLLTEHGVL